MHTRTMSLKCRIIKYIIMHTGTALILDSPFFKNPWKRPGALYRCIELMLKCALAKSRFSSPLAYKRKNYNNFLPVYRKIKPIYGKFPLNLKIFNRFSYKRTGRKRSIIRKEKNGDSKIWDSSIFVSICKKWFSYLIAI